MDTPVTICYGIMIGLLVGANIFHANQILSMVKLVRSIRDRQDDDIDMLRARVAVLEEILTKPQETEA